MLLPTEFPKHFHQPTQELKWLDKIFEDLGASIEWRRRTGTSWFAENQFKDAGKLAAQLRPHEQQDELSKYLYGKLTEKTQGLLAGQADNQALARSLAQDFNRLLTNTVDEKTATLYAPERFQNIKLPPLIEKAAKTGEEFKLFTQVRLNRRLLEEAYPESIVKSLGGVYPDTEILEPSEGDSEQAYHEFYADAERRAEHDVKFPNEPPQVHPDEHISTENGQLQVTGQGAVMRLNGKLTEMIFERNPDHEFYEEESFPLDWMYPHLTPFGIIMKINRQTVPEITPEMIARDHQFWKDYSERTIGDWINYETSVKEICDFCRKVYVRHDYSGFKGDPKFVRDEDAQKSFSKLRNAIGASIYEWRGGLLGTTAPPPPPVSNAVRDRMWKESEFALKQSFAYCPLSPEAIFHLMQLFTRQRRSEDIWLILSTAQTLDPHNEQFNYWLRGVERSMVDQAQEFIQTGKSAEAETLLDSVMQDAQAEGDTLLKAAQVYAALGKPGAGAAVVRRLTESDPDHWESWFLLARMQAQDGKAGEAATALGRAFALNPSDRLTDQALATLHDLVRQDTGFDRIRQSPEYQKVMATKN